MRRPLALLLALAAFAGGTSSTAAPSAAQAPLTGAVDAPATTSTATATATSTTTTRYFGKEAFAAVRASVAAVSRPCVVSNDGLTALVMAPIFKESSAATTQSSAPSPMTLSRYDEWNGVMATTNNQSANYGLYAFQDPYTKYFRAYWHPGIGIWQYDSAGLGAPFTTVETMDVGIMATNVAKLMANRYCAAAGTPEQNRRYEAWRDWGFPCDLCEGFFQEMMTASPRFSNLSMVDGITPLGGTVQRTCTLEGVAGTMPCWYVNPSVGTIQGSTSWATFEPDGYGDPTRPPAPLSRPFYVIDRGATEERHWLRADTGYDIDISASRQIGKNARPRSTQAGSGLTWRSTSGLCDRTAGRGVCAPPPPPGFLSASFAVTATYQPHALDADGDGRGDILWYRPGTGGDVLWLGDGGAAFRTRSFAVDGSYDFVLTGDIDGLNGDEVVWYDSRSGAANIWWSQGDGTFTNTPVSIGAGRTPFLLDSDGDDRAEVFWYGVGSVPDAKWTWTSGSFTKTSYVVTRAYRPFVGDFDGNGRDDIFWYGPGTRPDSVWYHAQAGGFSSVAKSVGGDFHPVVGGFDGDGPRDILWYQAGSAPDSVWFGVPGGSFTARATGVNETYNPVAINLDDSNRDSIVWDAPGSAPDFTWIWAADRTFTDRREYLPGSNYPVVGPFSSGGRDGVLWYLAGTPRDVLWYR
ncbi:MAG: FG-GAP repeat domain-containing protein [Acidimicrobiales bacterium]